MSVSLVDEIYERVKELPADERLRLVERIAHDLATQNNTTPSAPRHHWRDIRGSAVGFLNGEDAQEWISRSRREADEHREKQWKRDP